MTVQNPNSQKSERLPDHQTIIGTDGDVVFLVPEQNTQFRTIANENGDVLIDTGSGETINHTALHAEPAQPSTQEYINFREKGALAKIARSVIKWA